MHLERKGKLASQIGVRWEEAESERWGPI